MKNILLAVTAALLMAAGTGCQSCGPCGDSLGCLPGGCGDACACGDSCGDVCGGDCCGSCGPGGLLGEIGNGGGIGGGFGGHGFGPVDAAGGLIGRLGSPSGGSSRISGNFNWHQTKQAKHATMAAQPGPPTGAYTYPYYTTRGPRDFFMDNPPPLGR